MGNNYRLVEGIVDSNKEHIKICYSEQLKPYANTPPVALVAKGTDNSFVVQFLLSPDNKNATEILNKVRSEIKFFLIEKGEENPWAYARYHCSTASNVYSSVHWHLYPESSKEIGHRASIKKEMAKNNSKIIE